MAFGGLDQAISALMGQFGPGGQTVAGAAPSAYQVNQQAASVPSWQVTGQSGGNAPMAGPQSVPGMTSDPGSFMGMLQSLQGMGGGQQGGNMARQGVDMLASAGLTAALTPLLGPFSLVAGPALSHIGTSFIPHKGGQGATAPSPQQMPLRQAPVGRIPDLGMDSPDQYTQLLQMLMQR